MPGGTGGPHRIQGVGFWAQQKYYNIFSVDSGPFIFRPPIKGLPDQPFPPNAFQSWTYSYNLNLIGQDRFPSGEQVYDRPPLGPIPAENLKTWTWSYNLNLRGKDRLPVGAQLSELPPRPPQRLTDYTWIEAGNNFPPLPALLPTNVIFRPYWRGLPEQPPAPLVPQGAFPNLTTTTLQITAPTLPVPLAKQITELAQQPSRLDQTWTWQYNNNLIGRDALPVGEQVYTLVPSQTVPEQIQLHAWQWSYNLDLIGRDRLPIGDQVSELAPSQKPPEQVQLHAWQWSYNLNLRGKDQLLTGEQVWELAPSQKPAEQPQLRAWTWSYNQNLIGQDRLPAGEQVWERPTLPIPPAQTWLDTIKYNLIAKPFAQYDWPNAVPPYRIEQTWSASYNQNLIGQDKLPAGEQISELPPRDFVRLFQTWIQSVNLALTTAPPNIFAQARQQDWPVPRGAEPDWRRSWEFAYNKNLIGQDQLPNRQQDWPNPIPPAALRDWIQQTNLALLTQPPALLPYRRSYFDLPIAAPQPGAQSWTWQYNFNLIGKDQLPVGAEFTELAPSQKAPEQVQLHSWAWWYGLDLIGQDQLPFRQQDWPLTSAAQRAVDLATWIDRVKFWLLTPFNQTYWPNPTQPFRDPTLATIAHGYNLDLIGQDQLPNRQQDWPNPTAPDPLASLRAFILPLNLNLIPAVALVPPLYLRNQDWPNPTAPAYPSNLRAWPTQGSPAPIIPGVPPPPVTGPAVYNKPMLAGPGYLNVIPGEKPS
jgi:hypothetical protein